MYRNSYKEGIDSLMMQAYVYRFDKTSEQYVLDENTGASLNLEELMRISESGPMALILALPDIVPAPKIVVRKSLETAYREIFETLPLVRAGH